MTIPAKDQYNLNNMNSRASEAQLGTKLEEAHGSHQILAAGQFTTAGGDVNEAITISGLLATDVVLVSIETKGATPVTLVQSTAAAGQINVELSADPSTDHVLSYMALRAHS